MSQTDTAPPDFIEDSSVRAWITEIFRLLGVGAPSFAEAARDGGTPPPPSDLLSENEADADDPCAEQRAAAQR